MVTPLSPILLVNWGLARVYFQSKISNTPSSQSFLDPKDLKRWLCKEGRKFLVEIFYYIKSNVCLIVSSSNMSSFALYVSVSNHPPTLGALPFKQSCNNRLSFIFLQPSLNLSRNTYCVSILSLAIKINTLHIYTSPFSNQIQRIY